MKKMAFSTLRTIAICTLLTITAPHFTEAQTTKAELIDSIRYYSKGILELETALFVANKGASKQMAASKSKEEIAGIASALKLIGEQATELSQEYLKKLEQYKEISKQYGLSMDKILEDCSKEPAIRKLNKKRDQLKNEAPKLT